MSHNKFFYKDKNFLLERRRWLVSYLKLFRRTQPVIDVYLWAYDYCMNHPEIYDGATMTEDLGLDDLDIEAMLHDVLYVALNTAGSFKYQYISDKIIKREMEIHEKSSLEIGKRFYLLLLKTPFFVPYARHIKNRKMSDADKKKMDELNILLLKGYKINWKRELKWVFVVIAILLAAFFRIDIINLLKLFF